MTPQKPEQLGVCSWSMLPSSPQHLAEIVQTLGIKNVQLALVPHRDDAGLVDGVSEALDKVGARITSGMFGTVGEDYTSPETIKRTGGIVPDEHWEENQRIAKRAAAKAKEFGLPRVMFHAGFLPHDQESAEYQKLADRIETIANIFNDEGLDLMFETGQETAEDLWVFLQVMDGRGVTNVGVNFDPANMILYDKGDPIPALKKLMPRVESVHLKDAIRTTTPGEWGQEVPVGQGEVDWPAFFQVLADADFTGELNIEREAGDDRIGDAKKAIAECTKVMQAM